MIPAILDHLWQSTVFAFGVWLLTRVMHNNGAHVRYGLWLAASVKFLIPFSLLSGLAAWLPVSAESRDAAGPVIAALRPAVQPFTHGDVTAAFRDMSETLALIVLGVWAAGALTLLLFRFVRWIRIDFAVWSAKPVTVTPEVPARATQYALEPGLVGIWRSVLLLPEGIRERLSAAELNSVVAHELSHLRRRDNLTATLHMLVESAFWFFPVVWWLGARLIEERERACDETVVASGQEPETYAKSILKICQHYVQSPLASVSGVSGADLKLRIELIMSGHGVAQLSAPKQLLLGFLAVLAVAMPLAGGALAPPLSPGRDSAAAAEDEIAALRAEQQRPRTAVPFDPADFDRYAGYYEISPNNLMVVSRKGDHFLTRVAGARSIELFPESDTKFFTKDMAAQYSFTTDANGRVTEMLMHQNGHIRHSQRIDDANRTSSHAAMIRTLERLDPEPSLRRYLASLDMGQPNYDEMMPDIAGSVRAQLPYILAKLREWGPLKQIEFVGINSLGAEIYLATYDRARVEWAIAPLTYEGKVMYRGFREVEAPANSVSPSSQLKEK